jgi:hypothetical protein
MVRAKAVDQHCPEKAGRPRHAVHAGQEIMGSLRGEEPRLDVAQISLVEQALATGSDAPGALDGPFSRFMDRVFLQVIQTVPERGPALFESLFRNTAADRLEHFLSGSIHPMDRLSVMTSLPTVPFLRAALRPA